MDGAVGAASALVAATLPAEGARGAEADPSRSGRVREADVACVGRDCAERATWWRPTSWAATILQAARMSRGNAAWFRRGFRPIATQTDHFGHIIKVESLRLKILHISVDI